jgi:hypothetical protein
MYIRIVFTSHITHHTSNLALLERDGDCDLGGEGLFLPTSLPFGPISFEFAFVLFEFAFVLFILLLCIFVFPCVPFAFAFLILTISALSAALTSTILASSASLCLA